MDVPARDLTRGTRARLGRQTRTVLDVHLLTSGAVLVVSLLEEAGTVTYDRLPSAWSVRTYPTGEDEE